MLFTPRAFQLAQKADRNPEESVSPFLRLSPTPDELRAAAVHARKMLLVHQTGAVKVGELIRCVELLVKLPWLLG